MADDAGRSIWSWGRRNARASASELAPLEQLLSGVLGVEFGAFRAPEVEGVELREPSWALPPHLARVCSADVEQRLRHTFGRSFRDVARALAVAETGASFYKDHAPDYVAYPRTEDDVALLLAFCTQQRVAVVPFGGGSSVVGGVEAPRREDLLAMGYVGVVSVDMGRLGRVLELDEESMVVRVQAGTMGPALEAQLAELGVTLRHYPQSFEFSTVGGWLVTRSGGHFATGKTRIDDFVASVRMVTPVGALEPRQLPASGAGPDPAGLVLGSEGVLGVVTEARLRVQRRPKQRATATVEFLGFLQAARAVREIVQAGLQPANLRLVSSKEAMAMRLSDGEHDALLITFESPSQDAAEVVQASLDLALKICAKYGGAAKVGKAGSDKAGDWKRSFLRAPYVRDQLVARGHVIVETFETAVSWAQFEALYAAVVKAVEVALDEVCGGRGMVTCRLTHVYPDGAAPYFSVVARGDPDSFENMVYQWDYIKTAALQAIGMNQGTCTHHHAVGKDHRSAYLDEVPDLFLDALAAVKSTLDPNWVLNPGVLLPVQKHSRL